MEYVADDVIERRMSGLEVEPVNAEAGEAAPDNLRGLHRRISEVAGKLYEDGHHANAIFDAFKAVEARVQELSGDETTGKKLMSAVFNRNDPKLSLDGLASRNGWDEQEGFMHIFMGAMQGTAIRGRTRSLNRKIRSVRLTTSRSQAC